MSKSLDITREQFWLVQDMEQILLCDRLSKDFDIAIALMNFVGSMRVMGSLSLNILPVLALTD